MHSAGYTKTQARARRMRPRLARQRSTAQSRGRVSKRSMMYTALSRTLSWEKGRYIMVP